MPAKLAPAPIPGKAKKGPKPAYVRQVEPREQLVLDIIAGNRSPSDIELARLVHTLFPDRVRYVDGRWFEKGASEPAYDDIPLRHLLIDAQTFIEDTLAKHRIASSKAPSVVPDTWRENRVGWALEVLFYSKPSDGVSCAATAAHNSNDKTDDA